MLIVELGDDYVLRAKTGWGGSGDQEVGWYVGYLEKENDVYFFATNIAIKNDKDAHARKGITRRVLQQLNLMPK